MTPPPGGRGAFTTQYWVNGVPVWRDGPWTMIDPRMTYGDTYRTFDGWFRADDAGPVPEPGPLDGPPEPAAMAAWLRAHGHDGHWEFGGFITDEAPEFLRAQGFRLDPWQEQMLLTSNTYGVRYAAGRKGR